MSGNTNAVRTTGRRAERHRATRDEILDAAWTLARESGLAGIALRDLGRRVGMTAQSLYSYFASKSEIHDAMFRQGYLALLDLIGRLERETAEIDEPRAALRRTAHAYMSFCTDDPVRYQLLFQRTIPDFVPSDESYRSAVEVVDRLAEHFRRIGIVDPDAIDLWTALMTGLTDQQISNDPGGDRWIRLVDRTVDMFLREMTPTATPDPRWNPNPSPSPNPNPNPNPEDTP